MIYIYIYIEREREREERERPAALSATDVSTKKKAYKEETGVKHTQTNRQMNREVIVSKTRKTGSLVMLLAPLSPLSAALTGGHARGLRELAQCRNFTSVASTAFVIAMRTS